MKFTYYLFFPFLISSVILSNCSDKEVLPLVDDNTVLKDVNPKIKIGSPIEPDHNEEKYLNIFKQELSSGEALWYARWNNGWTGIGAYDFTKLNERINWLQTNGLEATVHMLVGPDNYMPDWLINRNWQVSELDNLLKNMIYAVMDANDNKNKVHTWDVVNELFNEDGTYRTNMVWNKLGWETDKSNLTGSDKINASHPIFVRKAFQYSREKTKNKLELRDYNIENNNSSFKGEKKHKAIYQLLKHLLNTNVPIDVVGIQGHITVGDTDWLSQTNGLKATVGKFKSLGLDVYITEFDVRIGNKLWTDAVAQQQKNDYYRYVKQALEAGATRIHFWGIQDGLDAGWIPTEYPLPWDKNLEKKPAYFGIKQALIETKQ